MPYRIITLDMAHWASYGLKLSRIMAWRMGFTRIEIMSHITNFTKRLVSQQIAPELQVIFFSTVTGEI